MLIAHVIASLLASSVFDRSMHEHMPREVTGGCMPVWTLPLEIVFVPLRVLLTILDIFVEHPRGVSLLERPFQDLSIAYLAVGLLCYLVAWAISERIRLRKGKRTTGSPEKE